MHSSPTVTMALALGVGALVSLGCDRLRMPALLPLMAAGLLLGHSGAQAINAGELGPMLSPLITLGIGLLIFEGALHLGWRELRSAPRAVAALLTIGVVMTWFLGSCAAVSVLGMGPGVAILLGAMLTVTGPTVVQPILRRVRVTPRLRTVLGAESVLVDPIGVLLTIVALATILGAAITPAQPALLLDAARRLGFPIATGVAVGLAFGALGYMLARSLSERGRIHPQGLNLLAVGVCMVAVGVGELVASEAGLVAATVAAVCLANLRVIGVAELHAFKQQLATLTVGSIVVLLASRFDVSSLAGTGLRDLAFVAVMIAVVRPAAAALSLVGSQLSARERVFAAIFAPRGIVALSMAVIIAQSIMAFARTQGKERVPGAIVDLDFLVRDVASLERVMFITIVGTVVWASLVGPLMARWLGVGGGRPSGLLIVGGDRVSVETAAVLSRLGVRVTLVDSRSEHVARAEAAGAQAIRGDATDLRWLEERVPSEDLGMVLAWTGNLDVDLAVARWGSERVGRTASALWAAGKLPPGTEGIELGGGRLLDEVRDDLDAGHWRVASWPASDAAMTAASIPFIGVVQGRPMPIAPGSGLSLDHLPHGATLVGLVRSTSMTARL